MISALKAWFFMGDYAFYIWAAYGFTGILMVLQVLSVLLKRSKILKKIKTWHEL
ncbi:MAG: heme exporter protein CcmD [Legionellaceae bacterium]|nr:heme exporter protein CcmD [Legionellaceae bacterium]HAF87696.1 heme exporter protein CcmD [Legionellales bacterium]HCA89803.1 heme exporter protein CcmD [Legionellales bacterium]|tara:strand:+ start:389 stop:550 length:162 start_codon:yes stop_codon:yes gene_type:complete